MYYEKLLEIECLLEEYRMHIGNKIKLIRLEKHITQDELAYKLDRSTKHMSDIENGKANITFDDLVKISNILDVNIKSLIDNDNKDVNNIIDNLYNLKHEDLMLAMKIVEFITNK